MWLLTRARETKYNTGWKNTGMPLCTTSTHTHTHTHTLPCSETLLSHSKRQQERLEQHVEYKSHEKQSKKYYELVSKGTSVLENKFDELHSRHVDLKAVHKKVSQAVQSMEKYCDQLKEENKDVSERWTHLQAELQARMEE